MDEDAESTGASEPPSTTEHAGEADIDVALHLEVDDVTPPVTGWLDAHVRRAAAIEGVRQGSVSIAVVGDRQMAELNHQYHQQHGTTDVLSFELNPSADETDRAIIDGEIILCMDEAARQAQRLSHDVRLELLLYAIHGMLHLAGYDDLDEGDARAMHQREDELLVAIGFEPIYASSRPEGAA